MSGRDRQKAERKRLSKGGEYRADEVFASIPCTYLHAAAQRLSPVAFRVFWLANANWRPAHSDKQRGRALLGYAQIRHPLGKNSGRTRNEQPGPSAIAEALREVLASGFLELAVAGARPRHSGGARGKVAEYYVPCREVGARLPHHCLDLPRVAGKLRLHASRMRAMAAALSPQALRVIAMLISRQAHDGQGKMLHSDPAAISVTEIAAALGIPRSTAHLVLRELTDAKQLHQTMPGAGKRPATYEFAPWFCQFDRAATKIRPSEVQIRQQDTPTAEDQPHG